MILLIKSTFYHELWTKIRLMWFILWAKQLSFGQKCIQFEKEFAKWQERDDAVFVNSGSSANLALIQALLNLGRLKKGDRVGFSALGWSTTVMPLIELGLTPVPIDINLQTLNVHSENIPTDIQALFLTNLLGGCGDIDKIADKCEENNIIFLEDNCEALGTVYKEEKLGNYGLASTFSFYFGHHLSTIECGMICTYDKELARELRIVRAHGWDRNLDTRTQRRIRNHYKVGSSFYSRYTFYSNGYNLRPTEIQAFLGILQLPYLDEIIKKRAYNYFYVTMGVEDPNLYRYSNFAIPIMCKSKEERDELIKKYSNVIEMRPIVGGDLTQQPFYQTQERQPNAALVHERGLYIGNNPELTKKELNIMRKIVHG